MGGMTSPTSSAHSTEQTHSAPAAGTSDGIPLWINPNQLAITGRPWRKIHLDFHNTPFVGSVGEDFEGDEFIATLREASVDSIVVFAKDMHGYFYYPTARSDAVHPGLQRDLLGEQVAACRAAGIKVYGYYCATWDNLLAEQHPDWLVLKRDRTSWLPKFDEVPGWTALCLNNPEFVSLMLDDTRDLASRYDLDGIWYDMPFPIGGDCFCHLCLADLRAAGLDPLDTVVQREHKQRLWTAWQQASAELIESVRPGCDTDQNNNTRLGLGDRIGWMSNVDIEALPTGGWGYHYFPVDVRYARSFGGPVCGQTGRFQHHWADFGGLKHPEQLRIEVAGIVAQGAQVCIGDQPGPSGRLDPAVYATVGAVYRELEAVQEYLESAAPVVEAAVIVAGELLADPARISTSSDGYQPTGPQSWSNSVVGIADLLLDQRVLFDLVEPGGDLSRYRLLVVPDQTAMSASLVDQLHAHLAKGAAVIAAGRGLLLESGESWIPGAKAAGRSPFSVPFMVPDPSIAATVASFPYALYGGSQQVEVENNDATVLAQLGEPIFERTPEQFTSHGYSPYSHDSSYAAAWHQPCENGQLGLLAFDVGTDYLATGYWVYRELFGLIVDAVLPNRVVSTNLPPSVEITVTRQELATGSRTLVHVVPEFTRRRWGSRIDGYGPQPPLTDVSMSLALDVPVERGALARGDSPVDVGSRDGRVHLTINRILGPEIIVLE